MHHSKITASPLASLLLLALLILPPVASEAVTLDELREQVRSLQSQVAKVMPIYPVPPVGMSSAYCAALKRNLSRTMRGDDVRMLQTVLAAKGFLTEDSVTGYFGALTEKAVQEFQQRENILTSGSPHENGFGNAGPRTRAALAVCPPIPTTAPTSTLIQTSTTSQEAATLPTTAPAPSAQIGTVLASFTENNASTRNNAIRLGQAYLLPLAYSPLSSIHPLAFAASVQGTTQTLTAYNADAAARWSVPAIGQGQMTSGFDVNADGFPDVAIERKEASGTPPCNSTAMSRTWLELYSGENGTLLYRTEPTLDKCDGYAIPLWGLSSIAFGNTSAGTISLAKYYETEGTFFSLAGGQTTTHAFIYPSVPEYDSYYQNDTSLNTIHPDQGTSATSFVNGSHIQNGLTLLRNGINRFVLFTSQRAAQYHIGPKSATQLLADRPFIGTHPSLAGRNYGLVSVDPQSTNHVSIVASGATIGMFRDILAGTVTNEPEAGGERHVSIYNLDANTVDQKYHGSVVIADGSPDPFYNNRIIHPGHVYLPSTNTYSRIGYNIFKNGR